MPDPQTPAPRRAIPVWHPRIWWLHLVGLACVVAPVLLGSWQFQGWQERREAEARDLTHASPEPLAEVLSPRDAFPADAVGQPVELSGTWVPDATFVVTGRERDGVDGAWVMTPLEVGPDGAALLVVRGWTEDPDDVPAEPAGEAELVAWLQPGEGVDTSVTDDDPTDHVLPTLRVADLVQRIDHDLYGAYAVAQTPGEGLEQADLDQLPEVPGGTGLRNFLYALEWWVFAAFAAYMWWRIVRDVTRPGDADNEGA